MADLCSPMDINRMPDEVLLKILSFVPYKSAQQYKQLAAVNTKFRDFVVDSAALRIEIARQQFPEQTYFRGFKSIDSYNQIDTIVQYQSGVQVAVEKLCKEDDDAATKEILKTGILVLDYLHELRVSDITKNWMLIETAKQQCFSSIVTLCMRITMMRLSELLSLEGESREILSGLMEESPDHMQLTWYRFFGSRAIECAILSGTALMKPSQIVLSGSFDGSGVTKFTISCLVDLWNYFVEFGSKPKSNVEIFDEEVPLSNYVRGQQWRLLTSLDLLSRVWEERLLELTLSDTNLIFFKECLYDSEIATLAQVRICERDDDQKVLPLLKANWEAMGTTLREAVRELQVSEDLQKLEGLSFVMPPSSLM